MARPSPAGTPALRVLASAGIAHEVRPYEHVAGERSYGDEAVAALRQGGLDIAAEQVFKTLLADVDGDLVVAVVPVPSRLDLKALAAAVGGRRAQLAEPARVERSTGYVLGGVSPLGQKTLARPSSTSPRCCSRPSW